ncbi:hypothetical protein D9757_007557 [Collybiopsis confluens]|uniref:Uncharacterized protein n=1 Tax=Collybiopsis confluens TaxID=2823264 RepID=A0A8H5M5E6_9AGAR|nr:hypothetical protein D9757_007557 [Collybiopsis confluens]
MPPPPPPIVIFATPRAKDSYPVVQAGHEHLRNASNTIHQHRNSLASQLKNFDNRWAHLFSVAPVLNKLTKGRQRPEEFRRNAEGLHDDVKVALDEARRRRILSDTADEQDSIVPGPPPSTVFSRTMRALSSVIERVEPAASIRRASKTSSDSKTAPSGSKLKSRKNVKKKNSRHSLIQRSISPFRHRPKHRSSHSSRERHREQGREQEREREHRRRHHDHDYDYDERAGRYRSPEDAKKSDSDGRTRTKRSPPQSHRHRQDHNNPPEPPHVAPAKPVIPSPSLLQSASNQPYDQDPNLPPIYARFSTTHGENYTDDYDLLRLPVAPFTTQGQPGQPYSYSSYVQPYSSRHKTYGYREHDRSYEYDERYKDPQQEHTRAPPPPSSYRYGHSSDRYRSYNDDEAEEDKEYDYAYRNDRKNREGEKSDSRDRVRERATDKYAYHSSSRGRNYPEQTQPQSQPQSQPHTRHRSRPLATPTQGVGYTSTSTPVMPTNALLSSSNDPGLSYIPAPSSYRHRSRSRYPPSSLAASHSGGLGRNERRKGAHDRRTKNEEKGRDRNKETRRHANPSPNGNGYGPYGWGGSRYDQSQSPSTHAHATSGSRTQSRGTPKYSPPLHPPSSSTSPSKSWSPGGVITIPRSPLIMRSRFKENFSVLQSERG